VAIKCQNVLLIVDCEVSDDCCVVPMSPYDVGVDVFCEVLTSGVVVLEAAELTTCHISKAPDKYFEKEKV